jgi:hypothetical protein
MHLNEMGNPGPFKQLVQRGGQGEDHGKGGRHEQSGKEYKEKERKIDDPLPSQIAEDQRD